jgi:hypothetical protein
VSVTWKEQDATQATEGHADAYRLDRRFAGVCAICPISNGLLLRPFLANFDSRYISGDVTPFPFDRKLWLDGKGNHRLAMAHDLIDNNRLVGKTRAELVDMLGEPRDDHSRPDCIRWLLGYRAKGLFDESLWLQVTIREDGTASDAIIGKDWGH